MKIHEGFDMSQDNIIVRMRKIFFKTEKEKSDIIKLREKNKRLLKETEDLIKDYIIMIEDYKERRDKGEFTEKTKKEYDAMFERHRIRLRQFH